MKTYRILSFDGGGMRDLYAATVWTAIEHAAGGRSAHQMFDMVVGTSGGAIIAAALAAPQPLTGQEVANFFIRDGQTIFQKDILRHIGSAVAGPKYPSEPYEKILKGVFGEAKLSDTLMDFMATSYRIDTREANLFRSWKGKGGSRAGLDTGQTAAQYNYYLRDVARASSAAMTYFAPARIISMAGVPSSHIDGAMVANNPAMCAIASAFRLNQDLQKVILVSIGTGQQNDEIPHDQARTWGVLNWARPAFECFMDGVADSTAYQIANCFGDRVQQFRFDFQLGGDNPAGAIDDASSGQIRKLIVAARKDAEKHAYDIQSLPRILADAVHDR